MAQITTVIVIEDEYKVPKVPFETNEDYLSFVLNKAVQSYKVQYAAQDVISGVNAAREAYNNDLNAV